jgi:hypothetical protein
VRSCRCWPSTGRRWALPIKTENRARYPRNWAAISRRIRHKRARGRCECRGECGIDHGGRCPAINGERNARGSRVVLTVAHLDHTPEHAEDCNLLAMCNACHLRLDTDQHGKSRAATERQRHIDAGQLLLPEVDNA